MILLLLAVILIIRDPTGQGIEDEINKKIN